MTMRAGDQLRMYLETGKRRTFAVSVEWPGLARPGRTAEAAIEALVSYLPRYAPVARAAGVRTFPEGASAVLDVVERVTGNATTDFGAPGVVPALDRTEPWTAERADRDLALLSCAWALFDRVAAAAPEQLRKGPRGGGRDTVAIVEHVHGVEPAYARKAGLQLPAGVGPAAVAARRTALVDGLRTAPAPAQSTAPWPVTYVVRRMCWHVLDHAWELEDRSGPPA